MALSEHEQRMLDELERHLYEHDADVMPTVEEHAPSLSTRSLVLTFLAVAAGLGVILAGVAFQLPLLGVLGFALMVLGVAMALSRRPAESAERPAEAPTSPAGGAHRAATGAREPHGPSFMDKLDERWDRRQQNPGA